MKACQSCWILHCRYLSRDSVALSEISLACSYSLCWFLLALWLWDTRKPNDGPRTSTPPTLWWQRNLTCYAISFSHCPNLLTWGWSLHPGAASEVLQRSPRPAWFDVPALTAQSLFKILYLSAPPLFALSQIIKLLNNKSKNKIKYNKIIYWIPTMSNMQIEDSNAKLKVTAKLWCLG